MRPRLPALALAGALMLAGPRTLRGQTSPIVDLLLRARVALNDLHYAQADSLATAVLAGFGNRLSQDQRLEALSVIAASFFPEPAGGGIQRPESALVYLTQIVRLDPENGRVHADVSWPGLDSLFGVARRTTFAAGASPQERNELSGPQGEATVRVFATRPARFRLLLRPGAGGAPVLVDSAGPSDRAALRLRSFNGDRPLLTSGEYALAVIAADTAGRDSAVLSYAASVEAPPLEFVPVANVLDSTQLRPEIAPPARARGIVAGLLLGGGAVIAATLKGPSPLSSTAADSRGFVVGVGLALGAVIGGLLDRGQPLPENANSNQRLRAQFEEAVRTARAENQRRLQAYHMTITIRQEIR
jgi:hypothetical protein